MVSSFYPKANINIQWKPNLAGGANFSKITKLVLHSTETQGWPGYPTFAPHLTYDPWKHEWRQHFSLTRSATTLADPSHTAVRENRDDVIQVEIIGYCDPPMIRKYGKNVEKMDEEALRDLGEFAAWLHKTAGLPLRAEVDWVSYPGSYGERAKQRLSSSEYDRYEGILGHQHVSGNDHGDPGKINIKKILEYANAIANPQPVPEPEEEKGQFDMVAAKNIYFRNTVDQLLQPGNNLLRINKEGGVSVVSGKNDGVDVCANLVFLSPLPEGVQVHWEIIDYSEKDIDKVRSRRLGVTALPETQITFKGAIPGPTASGRSNRLRLFVEVPEEVGEVRLLDLQIAGWKM